VPVNFEVKLKTDLNRVMLLWTISPKMIYIFVGQCFIKVLAERTSMDCNFEGLLVITISINI